MSSMTETDARQKWCPFARVFSGDVFGYSAPNRFIADPGNDGRVAASKCLGRDCMAWRWADPSADRGACELIGKVTP